MTHAAHTKMRRTAMVPVATREERARMIASLKAAECRIAAGKYVEHDSATFVDRLMHVRAVAIRNVSS